MNEKELVKWLIPKIEESFQKALADLSKAEEFKDIRDIQMYIKFIAKDLKQTLHFVEAYDCVRKNIENATKT